MSSLRQLDDLLRGRTTSPVKLAAGDVGVSLRTFIPLAIVLGAIYGFFMGWYALFSREPANYWQIVASTVKLPALFLLTLVVTFPSLYVFNALLGCGLTFTSTLRLLVGAIVINVTVAASMGPILGFFTVSTTSYPFMIILNVALLAVAGVVALTFLLHTLRRISFPTSLVATSGPVRSDVEADKVNAPAESGRPAREPGAFDDTSPDIPEYALGHARMIFRIWVIIYGLVGVQMGWLLRPFIGSPDMEFTWFRERSGNFFEAVTRSLQLLLGV
jgi:hypothetical protein